MSLPTIWVIDNVDMPTPMRRELLNAIHGDYELYCLYTDAYGSYEDAERALSTLHLHVHSGLEIVDAETFAARVEGVPA